MLTTTNDFHPQPNIYAENSSSIRTRGQRESTKKYALMEREHQRTASASRVRVYTHLLAFPSIHSCCNKGTQKNRGHRFPRTFSTATPFPTNCILSGAFSYWKRDFLTGNIRNSYCDEPVAAHILLHWGKYTEKLLQAHQCRPFSCKYINSTSFVGIIRGEKVGGKWALTFSRC